MYSGYLVNCMITTLLSFEAFDHRHNSSLHLYVLLVLLVQKYVDMAFPTTKYHVATIVCNVTCFFESVDNEGILVALFLTTCKLSFLSGQKFSWRLFAAQPRVRDWLYHTNSLMAGSRRSTRRKELPEYLARRSNFDLPHNIQF